MPGFEPGASASRTLRANQAAPHPVGRWSVASRATGGHSAAIIRRAPRTASSTGAARSARQISRSGRYGSGWLYTSGEPSMREQWQPGGGRDTDRRGRVPLVLAAAVRVHVGVAHHDGHRLGAGRTERHELGVEHLGEVLGDRGRPGARHEQAHLARPCGAARGGGSAVESTWPWPGQRDRRDAWARRRTRARRARPSRCGLRPTRGCRRAGRRSTRARASRRAGESFDSSDNTASSGRAAGEAGEDQLVAEPVTFVFRRVRALAARAGARRLRVRCRRRARGRPLS